MKKLNALDISVKQLQAACTFLGWTHIDLSEASGVTRYTITKIVNRHRMVKGHAGTLRLLTDAFANNGIIFFGDNVTSSGLYLEMEDQT